MATCTAVRKDDVIELSVAGRARLDRVTELSRAVEGLDAREGDKVVVDFSRLDELDTSGALAIVRSLIASGVSKSDILLRNASPSQTQIFNLVKDQHLGVCLVTSAPRLPLLQRLGYATCSVADAAKSILTFLGETTCAVLRALAAPRKLRLKELFVQLEIACIDAVPIVAMVTFLVGVVVAYLFASQAERYGANVFVIDALALAMCRELSPIIVAIIVAGRSGSAYTAQIGTMKLNEELDAMISLGLSPMQVLVIPRLFALAIAVPLLTFAGDIAGMFGGMLIADIQLGLTGVTFIDRVQRILTISHVLSGLVKAAVFAVFIAIIGCRMGLNVENNARSVGLSTTSTVVQSIVAVILLNAAFAIIFVELGI